MAKPGDKFRLYSVLPQIEPITVLFKGIQETGFDEFPAFPLYDVLDDIPGHPAHSTVGRDTIEEFGYVFPDDAP